MLSIVINFLSIEEVNYEIITSIRQLIDFMKFFKNSLLVVACKE